MTEPANFLQFPQPTAPDGRVDLLIVAGEHSGDQHAAHLLRELRAKRSSFNVAALGGPALAAAGAQLIFDLTASSVVGYVEVIKKYRSFFRPLFEETLRWIAAHRPKAVLFVDYPGFNLRIAKALFERGLSEKAGGPIKLLYYISPQIWAWKAGKRFAMAEHLNALAVIFPFEVACYADTALPVEFTGHPFVDDDYVSPVSYDPAGPVLLLPGSRTKAVARIFPMMLAGYARFAAREAVVLYPAEKILTVLKAAHPPASVKFQPTGEPIAASAVLTSSGTMSMHCALAGIPGAVVYRANPIEYMIGRLLVKVPFIGIANLLLGEAMYPEYIQGAARPDVLGRELRACVQDPTRRSETEAKAERLRALLHRPAAGNVADWVLRKTD